MSQLLFLVETTPQCQSDYLYLRAFIQSRYRLFDPTPKLTPIYLRGKSHYQDKESEIQRRRNEYPGQSEVILCLDTDEGKESEKLNARIGEYCRQKGYYLVWFHRDVEEVFLDRRVLSKEAALKKKAAEQFGRKNAMDALDQRHFEKEIPLQEKGTSNLALVLDALLPRKSNSSFPPIRS
jgi:hypothetical protein